MDDQIGYTFRDNKTIRMKIGMREYRKQDSLDFHPFSFNHVYFNVVIEFGTFLKLHRDSYIFDFAVKFATPFKIQVSNDLLALVGFSFSKIVLSLSSDVISGTYSNCFIVSLFSSLQKCEPCQD